MRQRSGRVRVGILGVGSWSTMAHIPALREDPEVELVVVSRRDEAAGRRIARAYGFGHYEQDWRVALGYDLDAVIVNSPPVAHVEQVCEALESGAHVLCEKPFALAARDAITMLEASRRHGRALLVGFGWNRHPLIGTARERLPELEVPEYTVVQLEVATRELFSGSLPDYMAGRDFPPRTATYADPSVSGGGSLLANASHALGLMLWLLGSDVSRIMGRVYRGPIGPDLHDTIWAEYADGRQAVLSVVSVHGRERRVGWRWGSYGPGGSLHFDTRIQQITLTGEDGSVRHERVTHEDGVERLDPTRSLVRVARTGQPVPELDAELAVDVVRLTDATLQSIERNAVVDVPSAQRSE